MSCTTKDGDCVANLTSTYLTIACTANNSVPNIFHLTIPRYLSNVHRNRLSRGSQACLSSKSAVRSPLHRTWKYLNTANVFLQAPDIYMLPRHTARQGRIEVFLFSAPYSAFLNFRVGRIT